VIYQNSQGIGLFARGAPGAPENDFFGIPSGMLDKPLNDLVFQYLKKILIPQKIGFADGQTIGDEVYDVFWGSSGLQGMEYFINVR
jgi:hypothetical protein